MVPRNWQLATRLVGLNAALILVSAGGVGLAASSLLGRQASEEARARAGLAASAAREALDREAMALTTTARLLAERPTVDRLVREGRRAELASFLERFRSTSGVTACAVEAATGPLAVAGPVLPWEELGQAAAVRPGPVLVVLEGQPHLVVAAGLPGRAEVSALAVQALSGEVAARLGEQVGLPVRWLVGSGVEEGGPRALPADGADPFVAVLPWALDPRLALEVRLPRAVVEAPLAQRRRQLLGLALLAFSVAVVAGLAITRSITRPLSDLTVAAERIGLGDLSTPVAPAAGAEIGSLAATLEEARSGLLTLTEELARRRAEAEAILAGISEGVYAVDRERRLRYLNPQAAALLGVEPSAVLGRFCGDVLAPEEVAGERPCERRCPILDARFRGTAQALEPCRLGDGSRATLAITSAAPVGDRQIQVLRRETPLEAARRLRDRILANVSHEFKTPLAAQLAALELLGEALERADPAGARALLGSLERGTLRLSQLVDNLLESVRIEAGDLTLRRRPLTLDEVVEEAAEAMRPLLAQRQQTLEVELPYPLPELAGDGPRLVQVLVNLLGNAHKYAPPGSVIRVGGEVGPSQVVLWVDDEGPGLPAGNEEALFERFFRAETGETDTAGLGLGLAIARSIVERHGGRIQASSRPTGARFAFSLPLPERGGEA